MLSLCSHPIPLLTSHYNVLVILLNALISIGQETAPLRAFVTVFLAAFILSRYKISCT